MRVLLVDDVQDRLDRLEAGIEDLQPTWRVTRAEDARDAATVISAGLCDVIVAIDSRRSELVVDLLSQARTRVPTTLRIALGDSEAGVANLIKSEVAHRVL